MGIDLPQDPAVLLSGIDPKDAPSHHKDTCSALFIAAAFIIARNQKQPRCFPTKEWMKKVWCIYTTDWYYPVVKNNDILKFP